jgi:hypothetical protein
VSGAREVWDRWCSNHAVVANGVPLFACDEHQIVRTKSVGRSAPRQILCRHPAMDDLILHETDRLIADWQQGRRCYDGLIYIRHGRSITFQMAEVMVPRGLFQGILDAIAALRPLPAVRCRGVKP